MASLKQIIKDNELPVKVHAEDKRYPPFTILEPGIKPGYWQVRYDDGILSEVRVDGHEHVTIYEVVDESFRQDPRDRVLTLNEKFDALNNLEAASKREDLSYNKDQYRDALLYLTWDSPDAAEPLWDKFHRYFDVFC